MSVSSDPRRESLWLRPQALGIVTALLLGGLIAQRMWTDYRHSPQHDLAVCKSHLAQINAALEAYRKDHHGEYPLILTGESGPPGPSYEGLYPRYIHDRRVFFCPAARQIRYFQPGFAPHSYLYTLQVDPFLLKAHFPPAPKFVAFNKQLLRRFAGRTTVVECTDHVPPAAPRAGLMLSLKADGSEVWEPMGNRTEQEKLSTAFQRAALSHVVLRPSNNKASRPPERR